MHLYLPIAEMAVNPALLVVLGGVVGVLSGLFGVGGGFLMTPFLIFIGIPPSVAVGTQSVQLVATSISGCLGHGKRGNIDIHMGGVMLAGGAVGSVVGILLFHLLEKIGQIDFAIMFLYVFLLGGIGISMLVETATAMLRTGVQTPPDAAAREPALQAFSRFWPMPRTFEKSGITISVWVPVAIGALIGVLVVIMGVGGGFLLVPLMIYGLGMSTGLAAGTSLFQILTTACVAALLHAMTTQTVDPFLAILLMTGSVAGAQMGVRLSRRIRGRVARLALAVLITLVAFKIAGDLFLPPLDPFSITGR